MHQTNNRPQRSLGVLVVARLQHSRSRGLQLGAETWRLERRSLGIDRRRKQVRRQLPAIEHGRHRQTWPKVADAIAVHDLDPVVRLSRYERSLRIDRHHKVHVCVWHIE